jgi:hypothetical protein
MSLLELFVEVDDFCQSLEVEIVKRQLPGKAKRGPACGLSNSEIMTIMIDFHHKGYRNFKDYYLKHVCLDLRGEFPKLPSCNRTTL